MGQLVPPINFKEWIDKHREKLKPPVCNQVVYEDSDFIIMVVGGPNKRKDYHHNVGEEFFYQVEGDMILRIRNEQGKAEDILIREGEVFLLPANVHHSPQRFENTVGLVIEQKRGESELDGFVWYCDECDAKLYDEYIKLRSIVKDLPVVFEHFWGDEGNRTCKECGYVMGRAEVAKV